MSRQALHERASRPFTLDGETLAVRVRESRRARMTRVIVGPRRPLEIIVPRSSSDADVDAFLESKRGWIETKVVSAREIAARPPHLGLEHPGAVPVAGGRVPVERLNGRRAVAELRDGRLLVRGPQASSTEAIERWYRREARKRMLEAVMREANRLGLQYNSMGIRDQRTRWGSCSPRGNLSFSWRLLLAPCEVLEYVVVHELLHLREPNHTKAFWRLVEAARPGWQEQARWLREHGQELHEYRPETALVGNGLPSVAPLSISG